MTATAEKVKPATLTDARKRIRANGYRQTPVRGKAAFLPGWQNQDPTEADILAWEREHPDAQSIGIQTRNNPGVDIDVLEERVAILCEREVERITSTAKAPRRIGKAPKRLRLYRTAQPFKKVSTEVFVDATGQKHKVEILGDGQQFVSHGRHPDTGKFYAWSNGNPLEMPRHALPEITEAQARAITAACAEIMAAQPGWKRDDTAKPKDGPRTAPPKEHNPEPISADDKAKVETAFQVIAALTPELADSYDTWIAAGMALKSANDDEWALPLFDAFSALSPKYNPAQCAEKWQTMTSEGGRTIATILAWARDASLSSNIGFTYDVEDVEQPEQRQGAQPEQSGEEEIPFVVDPKTNRIAVNNQQNIQAALQRLDVKLRHDMFQERSLIAGLPGCSVLNDAAVNRLWLTIDKKFSFRPGYDFFVKVVEDVARLKSFHPVRDYLDGLEWDRTARIDKWLTTYAGAASTPYTSAVGTLILIAAVRRVRKPGCKFDEMPVLECPTQGTEKSTALAILAVRDEWFTDSLPLSADGQRTIEALAGRWIAEVAELYGMRKTEVEHIKAFLSRTQDRARMAYGRLVTEMPRQCVIIGTTNSEAYLRDITGNRRFWPVAVERFDLKALRHDRDQLWAEAAAREAEGVSIRLDRKLWAAAAEEQEARRIGDPWEEIIEAELADKQGRMTVEAAWQLIGVPTDRRGPEHNARLGAIMRKAGWERARVRDAGERHYVYTKGDGKWWIDVREARQGRAGSAHYRTEEDASEGTERWSS
jgi:hypothetical protein